MRTLIVDDNPSFLAAAKTVLDGAEFSVVDVVQNGGDALRKVEDLDPELVLLDIDLGEESGFALAEHIAGRTDARRPKLVLISSHPEHLFTDLIAESPVLGFLAKSDLSPVRLAALLSATPGT